MPSKNIIYDKNGDYHYDIISAYIKSIRGSDPDAAIYWLAVMLEGGENLEFIARRLIILASEDIGNAEPYALQLTNAAFDAVKKIADTVGTTDIERPNGPMCICALARTGLAKEVPKR